MNGIVLLALIVIALVPVGFTLALLDILARARKIKTLLTLYFLQLFLSIPAVWAILRYNGIPLNLSVSEGMSGFGIVFVFAELVAQLLLLFGLIPILFRLLGTNKPSQQKVGR